MSTKFGLFLPLICALIASSVARVQLYQGGANAIPSDPEAPMKLAYDVSKDYSTELANDITKDDLASVKPANDVLEVKLSNKGPRFSNIFMDNDEDSSSDTDNVPLKIAIGEPFPPEQWPKQAIEPIKRAETKETPTEVKIPFSIPVKPPTNFTNTIKFSDFDIPPYPIGADHRVEYYYGAYKSGKDEFDIFIKKAIPGFENILYQEAQIIQALPNDGAFPQLIYYDGRCLITTALCSTWRTYTVAQFHSGGMYLKEAYNMMIQMLDALKDMHSRGYVHRDINPNNIAYGCNLHEILTKLNTPFKLSETAKLYLLEFGSAENVVEPITNKYYTYAGPWEFASNSSMHSIEPTFAQDCESLGYVLIFGLNGGYLTWMDIKGTNRREEFIEKKAALDLDENLNRMQGDEKTIAKAKRDIAKYFSLVREHILKRPKDLLDYEALKACFNINEE